MTANQAFPSAERGLVSLQLIDEIDACLHEVVQDASKGHWIRAEQRLTTFRAVTDTLPLRLFHVICLETLGEVDAAQRLVASTIPKYPEESCAQHLLAATDGNCQVSDRWVGAWKGIAASPTSATVAGVLLFLLGLGVGNISLSPTDSGVPVAPLRAPTALTPEAVARISSLAVSTSQDSLQLLADMLSQQSPSVGTAAIEAIEARRRDIGRADYLRARQLLAGHDTSGALVLFSRAASAPLGAYFVDDALYQQMLLHAATGQVSTSRSTARTLLTRHGDSPFANSQTRRLAEQELE